MQADIFKDILVPVIGGLGIFMLGLEFMSIGIQSLAVNRMRTLLAKVAGTPITGLMAGTFITGVIQSSTAMTVMVVGLVNAGVLGLRPAISVIMGANIGTTLGNGLIALPLGPLGLILGGIFALVYVFARNEKVRNIALACMGFALIFYGLNLMTGGLRPLRNMPEVMGVISGLKADNYLGLIYCVLIAAVITALIHSSSATIGIVMGLGAAGVLDWQTAVAFSLGADLGTTITSWMASLNLSRNAKRAAYAHISFNLIGVAVMLPLFFLSMQLLVWIMGWFGGDPGVAVVINGKETFPLVPVAVGLYSTAFNIFNTAIMFPFISVFDRVLSEVGHHVSEEAEDYSQTRYLDPRLLKDLPKGVSAIQRETARYLEAAGLFLAIARGVPTAPADAEKHFATDRRAQPRYPAVHRQHVRSQHAVPTGRLDRQPDRGRGLDRQPGRDALPGRPPGRTAEIRAARQGTGERGPRPDRRRHAGDPAGDAGHGARSGRRRAAPAGPAGAARALPEAGCRPALGGARLDPDAAGKRGARVLRDRAHRCRTPFSHPRGADARGGVLARAGYAGRGGGGRSGLVKGHRMNRLSSRRRRCGARGRDDTRARAGGDGRRGVDRRRIDVRVSDCLALGEGLPEMARRRGRLRGQRRRARRSAEHASA